MDANENIQPNDGQKHIRWYDKQQTVSKSIKLLETFPIAYQEVLGDTIIKLATKHCNAEALMADLRTLGPEKVLSIFKAKSKNRTYDRNETVHQAMNYLYVLPDESRVFIATQVIEVVGHLFEYFTICQETGQSPGKEVVQSLSNAFVQGELQDTAAHLAKFYPSMNLPNGPTLKGIREHIAGAKTQVYQEEVAPYKSKLPLGSTKKQTIALPDLNQASSHQAVPQPMGLQGSTQPAHLTQQEEKPEPIKDETLAQDKRDMKIRLDKFAP